MILKLLVAAVVCTYAVRAADEAKYVCKANGDLQVTSLTVTTFTPALVVGYEKAVADCSDTATAPGEPIAKSGNVYSITIATTTTKCDHTNTAGSTVHTYRLVAAKSANVITKDDFLFTFSCDTSDPNSVNVQTVSATPTGDPQAGTVTVDAGVTLHLVKNSAPTVKLTAGSSVALTEDVKLLLELDTSKAIKKCKIVNCIASTDSSAFSNPVTLVGADGCAVNTDNVYSTAGGLMTAGTVAASKLPYTLSQAFKMFKFPGPAADVFFRCTCKGCVAAADAACNAPTCTTGRKRRDVFTRNQTDIDGITRVFVVNPAEIKEETKTKSLEQNFTNCLNHVSFIAVVAILALLLLVSLAVSVFFCAKLLRQKEYANKSEGYANQSYKA